MQPKLTVELVPKTSWYSNVRSEVSSSTWNKIKKITAKEANYCCEICGSRGDRWPVECHEVWEYDDRNQIQKLIGFQALCPSCHRVKHIGLAFARGNAAEVLKHLANINGWTKSETQDYLQGVVDTWNSRSSHNWELDLTLLETEPFNET